MHFVHSYKSKDIWAKISGPILDRIDIQVEVEPVKYDDLSSKEVLETSADIRKRVEKARKIQLERYKNEKNI